MLLIQALVLSIFTSPAFSNPFHRPAIVEKRSVWTPSNPAKFPTMGTSCNYAIVAKTGIASVAASVINGDIGVAPIAMTAITGFYFTDAGPGPSTSSQITGSFKAHAPESFDGGSATGSPKAALDMLTAYTTASQPASSDSLLTGLAAPYALSYTNPWGGQIPAGAMFKPGVYNWGSTVVIPVGAHVIIEGGISDIFIFVATGAISTGSGSTIILQGGVTASTIFWVTATVLTTGAASSFSGIIMTYTNCIIGTSGFLNGIILTQTEVALHMATITPPTFGTGCSQPSIPVVTVPTTPACPAPIVCPAPISCPAPIACPAPCAAPIICAAPITCPVLTCPKAPSCPIPPTPAPVVGKLPYVAPQCNNYIITVNIANTCYNSFQFYFTAYTISVTVASSALTSYNQAITNKMSSSECANRNSTRDSTAAAQITAHANFISFSVHMAGASCSPGMVGGYLS